MSGETVEDLDPAVLRPLLHMGGGVDGLPRVEIRLEVFGDACGAGDVGFVETGGMNDPVMCDDLGLDIRELLQCNAVGSVLLVETPDQMETAASKTIRTMVMHIEDPLADALCPPLKRLPDVQQLTSKTVAICVAAIKAMTK